MTGETAEHLPALKLKARLAEDEPRSKRTSAYCDYEAPHRAPPLANRLARVVWAVWHHCRAFDAEWIPAITAR